MSENIIDINEIDFNKIDTLDKFMALTQPTNSLEKAGANALYGIGHSKVAGAVPENRDNQGFTFFVRPQLNLSKHNLVNIRKFYSLLTTQPNSVQRYVRCMLDPRLHVTANNGIHSPLADPKTAFIPILTNTLKTVSGWPDIVMATFNSKQGVRKEQYAQADGAVDIYEVFDLDCNFKNTRDEPIILMMQTWLFYMSAVFEGAMSPYMDFVVENEIDYNTRIYRIITDETDTYVKKIAATGVSFPVNVPTGKLYDFTQGTKYMDQNKDINIRFKSIGAMYNDDILVKEFNDTASIFNTDLKKVISSKFKPLSGHSYDKIPRELLSQFEHRGYPLIDTNTFELGWWVDTNSLTWKQVMSNIK